MSTTPSTDLQELLAARRGDGAAPVVVPPGDDPPVDTATGEILPVGSGAANPPLPPVALGALEPAPREPDYSLIPPKVLGALPFAADYVKLAKTIQNTEMVPTPLRGRYDAIAAIFFKGFEMGMGPMQALASFDVIQGQVALKPEAMRALIMHEGHLFIVRDGVEPEGRYAEVECRRTDWPENQPNETYRYGWDDATLAKLTGKDNWVKMPRAMLDARATGGAARRHFPDVIQGMSYTVGEVMDFTGGTPTEAPEAPPAADPVAEKIAHLQDDLPPAEPEAVAATAVEASPEPAKRKRGRPTKKEAEARKAAEEEAQRQPLEPEPGPPEPPEEPPGPPVGPATRVDHDPPPEEPPDVERVPDPVQSPLGTLIPPEPEEPAPPLLPGEASVIGELRKSLAALIKAQPDLQQKALRAFLGAHFPGKKATDLDADQLTLAINIAGDWPDSIEQYPAPEPPPSEF